MRALEDALQDPTQRRRALEGILSILEVEGIQLEGDVASLQHALATSMEEILAIKDRIRSRVDDEMSQCMLRPPRSTGLVASEYGYGWLPSREESIRNRQKRVLWRELANVEGLEEKEKVLESMQKEYEGKVSELYRGYTGTHPGCARQSC